MESSNKKLVEAGALWKKTSKSDKAYLSISIEIEGKKIGLVAFPNTYKKEGSNQPDYKIYFSDNQPATKPADDFKDAF